MKTIVIGYSRPKKWFKPFSWAIRLIENAPYSHVYFRIYSEGLDVDLIYQASGVQVNFMGLEQFEKHAKVIAEFQVDGIDPIIYKKFMRKAVQTAGADYSIKQPIGIGLMRLLNLGNNPFRNGQAAWVCSELVADLLTNVLGVVRIRQEEIEIIGPKGLFKICKENFKQIKGAT